MVVVEGPTHKPAGGEIMMTQDFNYWTQDFRKAAKRDTKQIKLETNVKVNTSSDKGRRKLREYTEHWEGWWVNGPSCADY